MIELFRIFTVLNSHSFSWSKKFFFLMPLNLDNLCLAYLRLLYFTVFVAFQDAVTSGLESLGDGS